jgi:ribosomal protein L29
MTEEIDTPKHARDMSPAEYEAKLAELRRGASPPPRPTDTRSARDMTPEEREATLNELKRLAR